MSTRPEIDLISEAESSSPNRSATKLLERVFDDVLVSYKSQAYHSAYHYHVRLHGYPLPKNLLENSFYLPRTKIEGDLRKQINNNNNIVVLGCEGSGKTTLIHRVVGTYQDFGRFLYVDTSDLEVPVGEEFFLTSLLNRLVEAISILLNEKENRQFEEWIVATQKKDSLSRARFANERPEEIFQNIVCWLNVVKNRKLYFILDNIDSLSVDAGRMVFVYLNQLNTALDKKATALGEERISPLRYIVSCRTTTYRHVSSISTGMFVNSKPKLVLAEDDTRDKLSVPKLMHRFLTFENDSEFQKVRHDPQQIPIFRRDATMQVSFSNYVETISNWLLKSEKEVNSVIKPFCGRSIRRMKIYGLRAYASPIIAMLSYLEKENVVGITKNDPKYLRRRLLESLFDFRVAGNIDNAISVGFPVNIFRVVSEDDEFRRNPLLGVIAIAQLSENWEEFAADDVHFAKCMYAEPFVKKLRKIGYTSGGVRDLFETFTLAGILRAVPSSGVLLQGDGDSRELREQYIVDDRSVAAYFSLTCCDDLERSIQYFNASVRLKYGCGYYSKLDSFKYECLLNLVFIKDILKREEQLAEMNRSSGVALKPFSSRFKPKLIPFWRRRIAQDREDLTDRRSGGSIPNQSMGERLHVQNEQLFKSVSNQISKIESVI
ncbi:hypothetical protein [Roseibium sp. Sym1]|uniref:hypothetical protein n=1 Tax=Roseibium sp. Sym1 TaxID=3016006 RepID=UPI0022B44176|nr:hypothetical protein [Roseibium sp. Sym1]